MLTPPPEQPPSNYPRPNLEPDRLQLREVAIAQRHVLLCAAGEVGIGVLNAIRAETHLPGMVYLNLALALVVLIFMILSVSRLARAPQLVSVLYIVLMFVPCVSLIALLVFSGKASARLQQAGIKVGLLGADPSRI